MSDADRRIARTHGLEWNEADAEKEYQKEQIRGTNARVLLALAAARAEEHARCVRLLEKRGDMEDNTHWSIIAADWLERKPPKGEV